MGDRGIVGHAIVQEMKYNSIKGCGSEYDIVVVGGGQGYSWSCHSTRNEI